MDPELERVLEGFKKAAEFVKTYRFEITEDYLALIAHVEALPQNQSGADKSGRWRGSLPDAKARLANVELLPRQS